MALDVDAYLARIGASRGAGLGELMEAHLRTVPFENLSIHLGEPISLDPDDLFEKVVVRRRGGYCYELNGLFAALLAELGFAVTLLAGRVWTGSAWGYPLDHLALVVEAGGPWLVDVGFGAHAMGPLRLDSGDEQIDPGGRFRIVPHGDDLDVSKDGVVELRLERHPRALADFEGMSWWHCTSPASHFAKGPICSRPTADGRISLSGRRLVRTGPTGRTEEILTDAEVLDAYRRHFGIALDRVPGG